MCLNQGDFSEILIYENLYYQQIFDLCQSNSILFSYVYFYEELAEILPWSIYNVSDNSSLLLQGYS